MGLWQQSLALKEQIGDVRGQAATLHNMAGVIAQQGDVARAMGLWQQSLALKEQIGDVQGKAATLANMAGVIARQGDVARAMGLWEQPLALLEQIGDVQGKAATLHEMAGAIAQQGDVARAMGLWQQSLALEDQIGDVQGKAATLHQMAGVIARQGDVARAMGLWEQSLALKEQIGDVQGQAATLANMAVFIAQPGDVARAMELWEHSLALLEQIGDVQGKAATLANMAWAAGQQGDRERQRALNLQAARALGSVRAWPDLVTVLNNLGSGDDADAPAFLAQALWLALRVGVPVDAAVMVGARLVAGIGAEHPLAPCVAAGCIYLAQTRKGGHPRGEEMHALASRALFACAQARRVSPQDIAAWLAREGLGTVERLLPALDRALEQMVGDGEWLFDRSLVGKPG